MSNFALITKIDVIELKIKYSSWELEAEKENLEFYKAKNCYAVSDDMDYITKKQFNNTKQRIRYYETRLNILTDDLIRLQKRMNDSDLHEAMI